MLLSFAKHSSLSRSISAKSQRRHFAVGQNVMQVKHQLRMPDNKPVTNEQLFKGKKVVILGVPGAFTPVCSTQHVPSFLKDAEKLKEKGVNTIACVSINDSFVMQGWAQSLKSDNKVQMLADWNGDFTKALGMNVDLSGAGLGARSKRYVMLIDDGKIVLENVEASPAECKITTADAVLKHLSSPSGNAKK